MTRKNNKFLKYPIMKFNVIFFICPKIKRILSSGQIVIYYVLNNNIFYTQLAFAFVPQKDSYLSFLHIEKEIIRNI